MGENKEMIPLELAPAAQEEDEDDDDGFNIGDDDGKDPKKKKMKNAMVRFKKKYHDVITK